MHEGNEAAFARNPERYGLKVVRSVVILDSLIPVFRGGMNVFMPGVRNRDNAMAIANTTTTELTNNVMMVECYNAIGR